MLPLAAARQCYEPRYAAVTDAPAQVDHAHDEGRHAEDALVAVRAFIQQGPEQLFSI